MEPLPLEEKRIGMNHCATVRGCPSEKIRTKPFTLFESQIMTGGVFHGRHEGYKNAFHYDTVMALLNLDDLYLSELFKKRWYMSLNSPNLLAFHRADHFGDPKRTLKSSVLQLIQDECELDTATLEAQVGTVFLLTTIRCMGYCFNPISVYYCMSFEDPSVCLYVVLEVTNTPWLEKQCHVLRVDGSADGDKDGMIDARIEKKFYVSAFIKMDCEYRVCMNHPGELLKDPSAQLRMLLEVHDCEGQRCASDSEPEPEEKQPRRGEFGRKVFTASLSLKSDALEEHVIRKNKGDTAASIHAFFIVCEMAILAWHAQLYINWHALKLICNGQPTISEHRPQYKGTLRKIATQSRDVFKHAVIFIVALVSVAVVKSLKYAVSRPGFVVVVVGAAVAATIAFCN